MEVIEHGHDPAHYKPGSITRIKLENFLTYANVEFCPGPRLNVVIGPNGTGKSTILCAVCLGLGGQPPLLGRADDARLFIMHNKQIATVEIELCPIAGGERHVFKRIIDRSLGAKTGRGVAASAYFVNGKKVNVKEVQRIVKEVYKLAIDNMCTFLPQDRVGSFSGFNSKMLLQETEKSLSSEDDLYQIHMDLIRREKEIRESGANLSGLEDKLKREEEEHVRLKREYELMTERREAKEKLNLYEKRKLWVRYDCEREKTVKVKEESDEAKKKYQEKSRELAPLQEALNAIERDVQENHSREQAYERNCVKAKSDVTDVYKKADRIGDNMDHEVSELSTLDANQRSNERRVEDLKRKLVDSEAQLRDMADEEEVRAALNEYRDRFKEVRMQIQHAKRDLDQKHRDIRELKSELHQFQERFNRMKDDKARRNDRILGSDQNLAQVYQWINQNRKMFRRQIWGPIVCEITPQSATAASILESCVNPAVMKSFVTECREDMDLLFREVREKLGLRINIQNVDQGRLKQFKRKLSESRMESVKKYGIIGYVDEIFEAPDAVLQAMCSNSGIDTVLVGDETTYEALEKRNLMTTLCQREDGSPMGITLFSKDGASGKIYRHQSNVSRYSRKLNTSIAEISPARMLKPGVPEEEKARVRRDLQITEEKMARLEPSVQEAQKLHESLQADGQKMSVERKSADEAMGEIIRIKSRVASEKRKLKEAEEMANKDNGREKRRIMKTIKGHVNNQLAYIEKAASKIDIMVSNRASLAGVKMMTTKLDEKKRAARNILETRQGEMDELRADAEAKKRALQEAKHHLRELSRECKEKAPINDEEGNELPLKAQLEELPDSLEDIDIQIEEYKEKLDSIADNPGVIERYESQRDEMMETRKQLEEYNSAEEEKKKSLDAARVPWEASLTNLGKEVNELFGKYMQELEMAGEIRIAKGEEDSDDSLGDFQNWGIEIRVKFREKSDLQVLSAQVHSGGERSVSTIMYLMALQDLMTSPFRCVDEINQGLDERNERLVFKRIVQNSTKPPENEEDLTSHCGQYFLITPKLLPNMTDMEQEDVTILCVFNGKFNDMRWEADSYNGYDGNEADTSKRLRSPSVGQDSDGQSPTKKRKVSLSPPVH